MTVTSTKRLNQNIKETHKLQHLQTRTYRNSVYENARWLAYTPVTQVMAWTAFPARNSVTQGNLAAPCKPCKRSFSLWPWNTSLAPWRHTHTQTYKWRNKRRVHKWNIPFIYNYLQTLQVQTWHRHRDKTWLSQQKTNWTVIITHASQKGMKLP